MNTDIIQTLINRELSSRTQANPRYSLRAFAKSIGVDAGSISKVLNGRQPLSLKMAKKILECLSCSPDEEKEFLKAVVAKQQNRSLKRRDPNLSREAAKLKKTTPIDLDIYHLIADWKHSALLELVRLPDFSKEPQWIAKKLGITQLDAKLTLQRLLDLDLLVEEEGVIKAHHEHLYYYNRQVTSKALKTNQKEIRKKAIASIDNDPVEKRSMTYLTMCIDKKRIAEAKLMIEEFNKKMSAFLEGGDPEHVYTMEIGLFPLQVLEEDKGEQDV